MNVFQNANSTVWHFVIISTKIISKLRRMNRIVVTFKVCVWASMKVWRQSISSIIVDKITLKVSPTSHSITRWMEVWSFKVLKKKTKKERKDDFFVILALLFQRSVNGSITLKISGVLTGGYFRLRNSLIRIFVEKNIWGLRKHELTVKLNGFSLMPQRQLSNCKQLGLKQKILMRLKYAASNLKLK